MFKSAPYAVRRQSEAPTALWMSDELQFVVWPISRLKLKRQTEGDSEQVCSVDELELSDASFIPRSGSDLQPNVAASGYVGYRTWKGAQPHRGCGGLEPVTQGSRGGNPGLEVGTASRYLIRAT